MWRAVLIATAKAVLDHPRDASLARAARTVAQLAALDVRGVADRLERDDHIRRARESAVNWPLDLPELQALDMD